MGSDWVHHHPRLCGRGSFVQSGLMKISYRRPLGVSVIHSLLAWVLVTIRILLGAIMAGAMRGCRLLCWTSQAALFPRRSSRL